MGTFTTSGNFAAKAKIGSKSVDLDPRLLDIMQTAAAMSGYNVTAFSGVAGRASGTGNHPGGYAMDVELQDAATGKTLSSYAGNAFKRDVSWQQSFPAYEQFAQTARIVQQAKYPELSNTFRWGGYWFAGTGNKSGPDMMHFDINPKMAGSMGGSTWETGATPAFVKAYGVESNGGLSGLNGQRIVAQVSSAMTSPRLTPPLPIPQVASELDVKPRDGADFYTPHLDADGNYVPSPNKLRTNTYPSNVTSADNAAYRVLETGLGSLSDPRTAALMDGPTFDPIGDGPSPIQLLDSHENESGGLHFSPSIQTATQVAQISAPVPMPGRPAALDAAPQPAASKQTVRVGKHDYTVGVRFTQGGFNYEVTKDGIVKTSKVPGDQPTILKGVIRDAATNAVKEAIPQVAKAASDAGKAIQTNAAQLGATVGGFFSGIFKGAPADGLVVEHTGERNGRPVLTVSGTANVQRAPAPASVTFDGSIAKIPAAVFSPTSFRSLSQPLTIKLPTTLNEALAGTSYATVGAVMDQHFAKTDPVVETPKPAPIVKAPAPSTAIVKPQGGVQPATTPGTQQARTTQMPADVHPSANGGFETMDKGPGSWGDFTKAVGVPLPAPAKVAPPAQRPAVVTPTRAPSVVVSSPAVGSVRTVGADVKVGHEPNAPVAATVPATIPQVKQLPAVQPVRTPVSVGNYMVQEGDTLSAIAARSGTTVAELQRANGIADPNRILAGKPLVIPARGAPVVAQPTTRTAGQSVPQATANTAKAAAAAAPIFVSKETGQRLAPVTFHDYDPSTQKWTERTIYRAA